MAGEENIRREKQQEKSLSNHTALHDEASDVLYCKECERTLIGALL
jgi:hypothetical protein